MTTVSRSGAVGLIGLGEIGAGARGGMRRPGILGDPAAAR